MRKEAVVAQYEAGYNDGRTLARLAFPDAIKRVAGGSRDYRQGFEKGWAETNLDPRFASSDDDELTCSKCGATFEDEGEKDGHDCYKEVKSSRRSRLLHAPHHTLDNP